MKKPTKEEIAARYRKWIAALRSGKYEQGRSHLKVGDKFCCLGVLVDLGDHTVRTAYGWITSAGLVSGYAACPPQYVGEALGFYNLPEKHVCDTLIRLNDTEKRTFNEIADYIETKILPEFL